FFGNFDFEHQLAQPGRNDANLRRINAELASVWLAIAEAGDMIWAPDGIDATFLEQIRQFGLPEVRVVTVAVQLRKSVPDAPSVRDTDGINLVPWGWSSDAVAFAQQHSLRIDAPLLNAVRDANDRFFSLDLETEWDCGLKDAA